MSTLGLKRLPTLQEPCREEGAVTSGGAAIGWVDFFPIDFECPAAWDIDVRGLLDIHNIRGS